MISCRVEQVTMKQVTMEQVYNPKPLQFILFEETIAKQLIARKTYKSTVSQLEFCLVARLSLILSHWRQEWVTEKTTKQYK